MTTIEFARYANERPELCEKLALCTKPEEVYAIATAEGVTDSLETFVEEMTKINKAVEISDADLENVSAGSTTDDIVVTCMGIALETLVACYAVPAAVAAA